jgi:hypothetical protein
VKKKRKKRDQKHRKERRKLRRVSDEKQVELDQPAAGG